MSEEAFVMSTEVQTEYERGLADGKAYMQNLADKVIWEITEVEQRNAKLVAALRLAEQCLASITSEDVRKQIREALALQQSTEKP